MHRYLIEVKSSIAYIFLVIMQNAILSQKMLNFDVIVFIKSVFNKDENNCHNNIFWEKGSYKSYKYAILW